MSSTQYLTDTATRHQVFLQRFAGGESKKAQKLLDRLRRAINARLALEPTDFQRNRLELVLKDIDALSIEAFNNISRQTISGAQDLAKSEAAFSARLFDKATTLETNFIIPADAILVEAVMGSSMSTTFNTGMTIEDALRQFSTKKRKQIAQMISDGVTLGETTQVISRNVGSLINTLTRRQLDSLVRTIANHTASAARNQIYMANSDVLDGYRFIATLDGRTTLICFDESTPVLPLGALENVFRRKYTGDMITITTASGKQITGTPNHPILTSSGWLALNEIEPRKHVVYSPSFDSVSVIGDYDIGMPTTFGKLYDSISKLPIVDVKLESASANDFHGDGKGGDGEVHILSPKCELRYAIKSSFYNFIKNKLLGFIHNRVFLFCRSFLKHHIFSGLPFSKTSKSNSSRLKSHVNNGFASAGLGYDFRWSSATIKKFDNFIDFVIGKFFGFASFKAWHHTRIFKHTSDCSCSGAVLPAQTSGGLSISVFADNVISKSSEFKSCHVYNLQSSLGLYIAGGIIVKNCASNDQKVFPIGVGAPMPPLHWGACVENTLITTKRGQIHIQNVKVGDYALTHTGKWKKVTAIMAKPHKGKIKELINNLGSSVRLTKDHPILTSIGYKAASDIEVRDKAFNYGNKFERSKFWNFSPFIEQTILIDAHNIKTKCVERLIAYSVTSKTAGVSSAINLNNNIINEKIDNIYINSFLKIKIYTFFLKKIIKQFFVKCRVIS